MRKNALVSRLVRVNLCVECGKAHGNALVGERILCANCHQWEAFR